MVETNDLIHTADDDELEIREAIERFRIKADAQYAEKDYLLERDGIGFAPRGNVCAVAAEKKAGKTWLCMAMSAALLSGEFLGFRSRCPEARVLYFDTEQDEGDGQRIQKRVHYACGWDFDIENDRFWIFHLREINADERRKFVRDAIKYLKPDFVIVDGIRDLLQDFNDLKESASVIQEHMTLSSELSCVIWDIIHVNPNSEKMRGHLGTELGNKVADILYMTKKKDPNNEDNVTYKMEETDARGHKDIHSVTFFIDDTKPYGIPALVGNVELVTMEESEKDRLREIMIKYVPKPGSISTTNLQKLLKDGESMGSTKAWNLIQDASKAGVIEKAINNKWVLTEKPITRTEELPFEKSDEDVPY